MSIKGREEKKEKVREVVKGCGKSYVKSKHIQDELDFPPDEVGKAMTLLVDDGDLEVWNEGKASYGTVYRVLI